jgi:hypothetical protein
MPPAGPRQASAAHALSLFVGASGRTPFIVTTSGFHVPSRIDQWITGFGASYETASRSKTFTLPVRNS